MICRVCGASGWFKTVRWKTGAWNETFVLCDGCYWPLADRLWIRAGAFTVTSRCDACQRFCNPRELVESRPGGHGKRDLVSTGICGGCAT